MQQAKRFGRVSNFVMLRTKEPSARWRQALAGCLGTLIGSAFGLSGPWIAGGFATVVVAGLTVSWVRRQRQARQDWEAWASIFEERLPDLMNELHDLPTSWRLFVAGRAIGERLIRESIPAVPRRVVPGKLTREQRLLRWVSGQCSSAPAAFHRGLKSAGTRSPPEN